MCNLKSISLNKNSFIKAIILSVISSVSITVILMCITCAILLTSSVLPYEYLQYIMIVIDAVSVFFGAYIGSRVSKSHGLYLGLVNGFIITIALMICGFCNSTDTLSIVTLLKAIFIIISSALGGIKGVNVKEKIRIK